MSTHTPENIDSSKDALASLRIDRSADTTSGRSWRKLIIATTLLLLGLVGWFVYRGIGPASGKATWVPEIMQNRVEVRLGSVTIQKGRAADAVVVATGYLQSRRQAKIGARAAGRIAIVNFEEGDRVKEGVLLAELEHEDLTASLAAATAAVARSKAALAEQEIAIDEALTNKNRLEKLHGSRNIAESSYDQARFSYLAAVARKESLLAEIALTEAQEQQASQLKENMFIRAPFDGTVISKDAEVGESILPGGMGGGSGRGSVATIADLDDLEIECDVQEDFISRVKEHQEADIAIDAVQNKKYHGVVRKIIPMGDRARATIKVQVKITDADELLFPEMAGTVYFLPAQAATEVTEEPRMFCPSSAIVTNEDGHQIVWIVDEEKRAQSIVIKAGEARDGRTEITDGLVGRERVVVNPEDLRAGTPVKIVE